MKTFSFLLRAVALIAGSAWASSAFAARDFVVRTVSSTELSLSWNDSVQGDRGYYIVRTGPDGVTHDIGYTGFGTTTFADRALEPDSSYTYLIKAAVGSDQHEEDFSASGHTAAWQNQDIGTVGAAGSVRRTGDVITVTGSGADIWGSADAFQFVSQPWNGDGTLVVRVDNVANTAQWAKAGIMFRESLTPGSRYVMAAVNPAGDGALLARATTGGESTFGISVYTYTPQWLKLVRHGSTFQAFQSRDAVEWVSIGTINIELSAVVFAGLAVTSHNDGTPCAAVFDSFNLSTWEANTGAVTNLALNPTATRINATWTASTTSFAASYLIEVAKDNFHTTVTRNSPNRAGGAVFDLEPATSYFVRVRPVFPDGLGLSSAILSTTTQSLAPGAQPAAPTSLSANAVASSQVNLMWADNSDNESRFEVESSTDGINFKLATSTFANTTSVALQGLTANTLYYFRVRALREDTETLASPYSNVVSATTPLSPVGSPFNVRQPTNNAPSLGLGAYMSTSADGGPNTYQWFRNGIAVPGATTPFYSFNSVQPDQVGVYTATISNVGGTVTTDPAILGVHMLDKVAGAAHVVANDIHHPNGNIYDQVLLDGTSASITADPAQVTRISYIDLNDDIVQVEFSGAGTLTISLDNASGPAPAAKYNQPTVSYMKGHASIVIANADETTNVAVFSVGRDNAVNQGLFRPGETYDGIADLASLSIMSVNGRFGAVFGGDAHFFATRSGTGIYAPNVEFAGGVVASDITASDTATPMLLLGQATDVRIAGGNLMQPNGRAVQVGMFTRLQMVDGTTSSGRLLPAQKIAGRLEQNGRDVTSIMTAQP